jgi:O-antigen ligase
MFILLSKLSIIIYLIYYMWYQEIWGASTIILYTTSFLSILFVLFDIISTKKAPVKEINSLIKMYFFFGAYAFLTGLFVCIDRNIFLNSCFRFFSFIFLLYSIWYVCYKSKSINWLINTIFISSLMCAFTALFFGKGYQVEVLVKTMSPINNPNTLGLTMIMGIFTIVLNLKKKQKYFIINYLLLILFLLVIVRCGSRKSLFAGIALIALGIIDFLSSNAKIKGKITKKKLIIYLTVIVSFCFAYFYVINNYVNSSSFIRLQKFFSDGGTSVRLELYSLAIEYWKTSPLFGIGLDQYKILCPYGFFSHSTYAELLSCTGIFGVIIFFLPIISLILKLLKSIYVKKNISYTSKIVLLMIFIELFIGVGQVFTFSFEHLLILFCISYLGEKELKKANERIEL